MAYALTPDTWVTITDLQTNTPGGVSQDLLPLAESLVSRYAAELEARANRTLKGTVTDERCVVTRDGLIVTRHRPITAISAFTIEDSGLDVTDFDLDYSTGNATVTDYTPSLLAELPAHGLISYTFAQPPHVLSAAVDAVVERVRRRLVKEEDDTVGADSTSEEGYQARYLPEGWTDEEAAFIESIRRRVGA